MWTKWQNWRTVIFQHNDIAQSLFIISIIVAYLPFFLFFLFGKLICRKMKTNRRFSFIVILYLQMSFPLFESFGTLCFELLSFSQLPSSFETQTHETSIFFSFFLLSLILYNIVFFLLLVFTVIFSFFESGKWKVKIISVYINMHI